MTSPAAASIRATTPVVGRLASPETTSCIDREDGICLLACEIPDDCPRGYRCEGEENRGHGGDSLVCIGD